jgi:hypothetical protein
MDLSTMPAVNIPKSRKPRERNIELISRSSFLTNVATINAKLAQVEQAQSAFISLLSGGNALQNKKAIAKSAYLVQDAENTVNAKVAELFRHIRKYLLAQRINDVHKLISDLQSFADCLPDVADSEIGTLYDFYAALPDDEQ